MVEFCNSCGTSLPKGDLTIKNGQAYTSHDYHCPICRQPANPKPAKETPAPEPSEENDLVIRDGETRTE